MFRKKNINYIIFVLTMINTSLMYSSYDTKSRVKPTDTGYYEKKADNTVPVVLNPIENIKYSSPITAFIESIPFKEGMSFKKDNVLLTYNCTIMQSEFEKSKSAAEYLREKADNVKKLYDLGGTGKNDLEESESKAKEAEAELKIKQYVVSQCEIKAPFEGQVVEVFVSTHEYIEQGKPIISIVELNNVEIKLILPSEWLTWIKKDMEFLITLDETNTSYTAIMSRITYSIDPVSNTFIAYANFKNPTVDLKPGMSGYAKFEKKL